MAAASAASFPSYTPYNTAKAFASVGPAQYVETVKVVPEPVVNKVRNVVTDGDASAVVLKADSEVNPDGYNYA